jgi:hypothetical protein
MIYILYYCLQVGGTYQDLSRILTFPRSSKKKKAVKNVAKKKRNLKVAVSQMVKE